MKILKVLLTGSNPDSKSKVAGIGAVINILLKNPFVDYYVLPVGRKNNEKYGFNWVRKQFELLKNLSQIINDNDIDLAHVNTSLDPLSIVREYLIIYMLKRKQIKTIVHIHGGKYLEKKIRNLLLKYFLVNYLSNASEVLVLSDKEINSINLKGIDSGKISSVPNAIDFSEMENISIEKRNIILFLGRIVNEKGIIEIGHAITLLNNINQDFEFHIAGDGPDKDYIINKMSGILGSRFTYHGIIEGVKKWTLLKESIILLLPSKYEGLPMVILEAMAAKVVPIASDVGSISTVITNNESGFLLPLDERLINNMMEKMLHLIQNKTNRENMSLKANKKIEADHSMIPYHKNLHMIYTKCLSEK